MTDADFRAIIASIENASTDELKEMFIETLDDHLSRRTSGSVPNLLLGPMVDADITEFVRWLGERIQTAMNNEVSK